MKTCPNCGEDEIEGTNGFFCGSLEGTSGRVYHTASCMRLKNRPRRSFEVIKQLESERDALQARVTSLQRLLDQRWEMMRELEEVCDTKDVAKAVEYIKGLKSRVKRLEEIGDQMAAWLNCDRNLGNDTYTAHLWKQAKESKP